MGDRIGALAVLQKILQISNEALKGTDRVALLSNIAAILADIDSVRSALKVAQQIEDVNARDTALFRLMSGQIVANDIYAAMAVADQLSSTVYKAKAFSILARFQTDSVLKPLARKNFQRALSFAQSLSPPGIQAIMFSEIARYQFSSGDQAEAAKLMDRILSTVKGIRERRNKDLVYAAIAKNQARSSRHLPSKKTASLISDSNIAEDVYREIQNAEEILSTL